MTTSILHLHLWLDFLRVPKFRDIIELFYFDFTLNKHELIIKVIHDINANKNYSRFKTVYDEILCNFFKTHGMHIYRCLQQERNL
jgi:hypothetical protein